MAYILVTGATSGIGRQTALQLAALGHHVGVHGRSADKAQAVALEIERAGGQATAFLADLMSLENVSGLAADVLDRWPRLDVLLNNAGLIQSERRLTQDGHESTWGINHLAHFLLTQLLLPRLNDSGGRVVCVASDAHYGVSVPFADLDGEGSYGGWKRYQQSKLMNVLFAAELARRQNGVAVVSLHPGFVASNFGMNAGWVRWMMRLTRLVQLSPDDGAATSVFCATTPNIHTGGYYAKSREKAASKQGQNEQDAKRLWEMSEARVAAWLFQ
ncbi:MAG: NAD(P)-dependent dehydrogenase (short-subunit alcohol dehydrogenase family) [Myxococcota bacterium]